MSAGRGERAFRGAEYRQHNPHVGDGKQAFIDYFDQMSAEFPGKRVVFKRVLADGDFVVLHCHQIWPDEEYAGIDIFRVDDDGKSSNTGTCSGSFRTSQPMTTDCSDVSQPEWSAPSGHAGRCPDVRRSGRTR